MLENHQPNFQEIGFKECILPRVGVHVALGKYVVYYYMAVKIRHRKK